MTAFDSRSVRRWLTYLAAIATCGCGGSSSTPTPTSPSATLTAVNVTGPSAIIVGELGSLSASEAFSNGTKQGVNPANVMWQSSNPAVASVSDAGVITGLAAGVTSITAKYLTETGTLALTVSGSGVISACGTYIGPGPFTAAGGLANQPTPCLQFSNVVGGQLDCQGQDVSSIRVVSAQGFSIRNCVLHGTALPIGGVLQNLNVLTSSRVTVDGADAIGEVFAQGCQNCVFSNDTFVYPKAGFTPPNGSFASCEVCLSNGQNNTISQSTIDGGWTGVGQQPVDDGIGLNNESNVTLRNNTIRNVFDAGIESDTSPSPVTATIVSNTISNAGFAGIGSYYSPGWQNSVFSGNTVSSSPTLFYLVHAASASAGVTAMTLVNNQFTGNTFVGPGSGSTIDFVTGGLPFTVQGNLVQNNNFGTGRGPVFSPTTGFLDGGGNLCGPGGNFLPCGSLAVTLASDWAFTRPEWPPVRRLGPRIGDRKSHGRR